MQSNKSGDNDAAVPPNHLATAPSSSLKTPERAHDTGGEHMRLCGMVPQGQLASDRQQIVALVFAALSDKELQHLERRTKSGLEIGFCGARDGILNGELLAVHPVLTDKVLVLALTPRLKQGTAAVGLRWPDERDYFFFHEQGTWDVLALDEEPSKPLSLAARSGHVVEVLRLLAQQQRVLETDTGALHRAIFFAQAMEHHTVAAVLTQATLLALANKSDALTLDEIVGLFAQPSLCNDDMRFLLRYKNNKRGKALTVYPEFDPRMNRVHYEVVLKSSRQSFELVWDNPQLSLVFVRCYRKKKDGVSELLVGEEPRSLVQAYPISSAKTQALKTFKGAALRWEVVAKSPAAIKEWLSSGTPHPPARNDDKILAKTPWIGYNRSHNSDTSTEIDIDAFEVPLSLADNTDPISSILESKPRMATKRQSSSSSSSKAHPTEAPTERNAGGGNDVSQSSSPATVPPPYHHPTLPPLSVPPPPHSMMGPVHLQQQYPGIAAPYPAFHPPSGAPTAAGGASQAPAGGVAPPFPYPLTYLPYYAAAAAAGAPPPPFPTQQLAGGQSTSAAHQEQMQQPHQYGMPYSPYNPESAIVLAYWQHALQPSHHHQQQQQQQQTPPQSQSQTQPQHRQAAALLTPKLESQQQQQQQHQTARSPAASSAPSALSSSRPLSQSSSRTLSSSPASLSSSSSSSSSSPSLSSSSLPRPQSPSRSRSGSPLASTDAGRGSPRPPSPTDAHNGANDNHNQTADKNGGGADESDKQLGGVGATNGKGARTRGKGPFYGCPWCDYRSDRPSNVTAHMQRSVCHKIDSGSVAQILSSPSLPYPRRDKVRKAIAFVLQFLYAHFVDAHPHDVDEDKKLRLCQVLTQLVYEFPVTPNHKKAPRGTPPIQRAIAKLNAVFDKEQEALVYAYNHLIEAEKMEPTQELHTPPRSLERARVKREAHVIAAAAMAASPPSSPMQHHHPHNPRHPAPLHHPHSAKLPPIHHGGGISMAHRPPVHHSPVVASMLPPGSMSPSSLAASHHHLQGLPPPSYYGSSPSSSSSSSSSSSAYMPASFFSSLAPYPSLYANVGNDADHHHLRQQERKLAHFGAAVSIKQEKGGHKRKRSIRDEEEEEEPQDRKGERVKRETVKKEEMEEDEDDDGMKIAEEDYEEEEGEEGDYAEEDVEEEGSVLDIAKHTDKMRKLKEAPDKRKGSSATPHQMAVKSESSDLFNLLVETALAEEEQQQRQIEEVGLT